jgi:hypothetical protein
MFAVRICVRYRCRFFYKCVHENPQNGDIDGDPLLPGPLLIEPLQMSMDDLAARCCEELISVLRRRWYQRVGERRRCRRGRANESSTGAGHI